MAAIIDDRDPARGGTAGWQWLVYLRHRSETAAGLGDPGDRDLVAVLCSTRG